MKKYFFTGLATLLPIVLTLWLFTYLIDLFTEPFLEVVREPLGSYTENLPFFPKKEGVVILSRIIILFGLILFTLLLGMIGRWFFFRSLITLAQKIMLTIPFVRTIYKVLKEIASAFFGGKKDAFKYPAIITFPSQKSWCLGFVTGEALPESKEKVDATLVPVFLPTAPHPISGYIILMPEKNIKKVEMSAEEAIKLTVSCGVIMPGEKQ